MMLALTEPLNEAPSSLLASPLADRVGTNIKLLNPTVVLAMTEMVLV